MTARQAKAGLKSGTLYFRPGRPPLPKRWRGKRLSDFQRERLKKTQPAMRLFLERRKTLVEIGAILGVTYQRVEQILALGLEWYEAVGWIEPAVPLEVAGETIAVPQAGQTSGSPGGSIPPGRGSARLP